ncbi:MAG: glycosyltransferase family 4 protein, partial [Chitinophagaceae bacterium]
MRNSRIVAVHLLNDFSGTSFVFSQALEALQHDENEIHVFTANPAGKGFLHEVTGAFVHTVYYRSSINRLLMALFFIYSQLYIFIRLLFFVRRSDLVYVNTVQPFGAALAAWMRGCRVVYHVHKVTQRPGILKHWLLMVVRITSTKCIYVSKYLRANSPLKTRSKVIYNSLPLKFIAQAKSYISPVGQPFRVLMLCSLKKAKGILQFVECAQRLPQLHFDLVISSSQHDIDRFFKDRLLPENLSIFPVQKNVHPFYASASLVVNLSIPGEFNESFGMTILEAMYYKKPVIVPSVGGVMELV